MQKLLPFALFLFAALLFTGCGQKNDASYTGYWQGEDNLIFEVINTSQNNYVIRNINGDLKATMENGVLTGKNSLEMPFSMKVKGDSAFYQFGTITTGYKRIDKATYQGIYKTLTPAI